RVTPPTHISPLSLHDALPICSEQKRVAHNHRTCPGATDVNADVPGHVLAVLDSLGEQISHHDRPQDASLFLGVGQGLDKEREVLDRKSTRLNSSYVKISYAVF